MGNPRAACWWSLLPLRLPSSARSSCMGELPGRLLLVIRIWNGALIACPEAAIQCKVLHGWIAGKYLSDGGTPGMEDPPASTGIKGLRS
eukprot:scaffold68716_cov14-Tisochrysis_lutea.AAC.2